jgi:hypothetical protein
MERTKLIDKAQQITITNQNPEGANGIKVSQKMWNIITHLIPFLMIGYSGLNIRSQRGVEKKNKIIISFYDKGNEVVS